MRCTAVPPALSFCKLIVGRCSFCLSFVFVGERPVGRSVRCSSCAFVFVAVVVVLFLDLFGFD